MFFGCGTEQWTFVKKTTSLARPAPHHSVKRMEPLSIIEEIMVEGIDMVEIINIEGDVLTIAQEEIPYLITKSGITMRHNNVKRVKVYWINPQKRMMKSVIGVV